MNDNYLLWIPLLFFGHWLLIRFLMNIKKFYKPIKFFLIFVSIIVFGWLVLTQMMAIIPPILIIVYLVKKLN